MTSHRTRTLRALATASILGLALSSCSSDTSPDAEDQDAQSLDVDLQNLGIHEVQELLSSGESTSAQLVEAYIDRIQELDTSGDTPLHSVLELNAAAVGEARERDGERERGEAVGPLHGVPVLIKANIASQHLALSAGNEHLSTWLPDEDADVVEALRSAGAIILGTTNMSEFAWHGTFTDSALGGRTANVFDPSLSASGSSGGSSVAVAAGFAPLSLGTDSCGSVVGPAAHAGLVGFRPSTDEVSARGVMPLSPSHDVVGPLGHSVADVALTGSVLHDGTTSWVEAADAIDVGALGAAYITWPFDSVGADPEEPREDDRADVREAVDLAYDTLIDSGTTDVDLDELDSDFMDEVLTGSGWQDMRPSIDVFLEQTDAQVNPTVATAADPTDAITFEDLVVGTSLDEETVETWIESPELPNAAQDDAWALQAEGQEALAALMDEHGADVLIYPTSPETAAEGWAGTSACGLSANTGAPSVQIPVGVSSEGLPIGLSVTAAPGEDATALAVAAAIEDAIDVAFVEPDIGQDD